jgi:hypothetical protein
METIAGPVLALAGLLSAIGGLAGPYEQPATIDAVMTAVAAPARSIVSRSMAVILAYARRGLTPWRSR